MTVEELFRKLSYGELSNHSVAIDATGTIKKERQNQIIHFANEALIRLHTRFPLIRSDKIVTVTDKDLEEPLDPSVIQVLSIFTAWGESLPFETRPIPGTIHVVERTLHIPKTLKGELQVEFQHRHPELRPIEEIADLSQEITLIPELHEALSAFIAAKVYGNMRTPEAQAASMDYRTRYEEVCLEAQALGVIPGEMLPQNKFERRGWI